MGSAKLRQGRQRKKVFESADAAVAPIESGASILVGGFGLCGNPEALIAAVERKGVRDLTLISNNAGNLGQGLATWLRAGIVRKVIGTYVGNNEDQHRLMAEGKLEVELIPQGTFVERIRAGGAGIAGFYTPTGVGTVVAEGKESRVFNGQEHLLELALCADFALLRAHRGDPFGNLCFWRTARNFTPVMATAAETSIAEVDALVALGEMDPDTVHLPGIFVHRLIEVREHLDPFEYKTVRTRPSSEAGAEAKEQSHALGS